MEGEEGWSMRAYRYALDPSSAQLRILESNCGAARFAFNHMLSHVKAIIDQRAAERTYDIPDDELTPPQGWSLPALRKTWNQRKDEFAPWWRENSKEAYNTGLDALAGGLDAWAKSRTGERSGAAVGFPRFKCKFRAARSIRFTTGVIRIEPDRHHVTLPRLGAIHTHESTRKLARRLEAGTARIMSATVRFDGRRWYCSFHVLVEHESRSTPAARSRYSVVGVDLGVKDLLVVAAPDGTELMRRPAPKPLAAAQERLRIVQQRAARRQGPWDPDAQSGRDPSQRWLRTQQQVVKIHARASNLRRELLHEVTTGLARDHQTIVIEDLNIAAMSRQGGRWKRGLNRAIGDAALGRLRILLEYKSMWNHRSLIVADRWFPSTQLCSGCGAKTKLPLSERTFRCRTCGLVIDRDLNAAINLARLGELPAAREMRTGTGSSPAASVATGKGRGAIRKTRRAHPARQAGGREASTLHAH
ncbi:IS607 family element RNA-guided endonuclease TnpB [Nocardia sp. NPDC051030]|uniref:IS607 family element RNA-guided endonuclease TnpB n=1 Tax=Nocardia sp. NPDC051030 TaxID=3155162 RepID=UPI00344220AA